jgi:hypothetical protein
MLSGFYTKTDFKDSGTAIAAIKPATGEIKLSAAHATCSGRPALGFGLRNPATGVFKTEVGDWDKAVERTYLSRQGVPSVYSGMLSFQPEVTTTPLQDYVVSFEIENPSKAQISPPVYVEVIGTGALKPLIEATLLDTETNLGGCSKYGNCFTAGSPSIEDARPLAVTTPFFCTASIAHDNPYPCDLNCLTVTITANAKLMAGKTSITIKNLKGTSFPFQATGDRQINITSASPSSPNDHKYFSSSLTNPVPGTGMFMNSVAGGPSLVLNMAADAECGETMTVTFCVFNPNSMQTEPEIQICANDVGRSKDLYATATSITCQNMKMSMPSTYIAYPLRIKYPDFTFVLLQTSAAPCDVNDITVEIRPKVPMIKHCLPCITLAVMRVFLGVCVCWLLCLISELTTTYTHTLLLVVCLVFTDPRHFPLLLLPSMLF